MSKKIEYEFKVDGFYDSVNYYRSEVLLNINSMPAPTATGITGLTYSDTTAEADKEYNVCFGSVKNNIEKFGQIFKVITSEVIEYADTYLKLAADAVDRGLKSKTFTSANLSFALNMAVFNGTSSYLSHAAHADFGFGTGDFTIEATIKSTSAASRCLLDFRDASNGTVSLWYASNGVFWLDDTSFEKTSDIALNDGNLHHIAVVRYGTTLKIYIDGVQRFSKTTTKDYGTSRQLLIGKTYTNTSYFDGSIKKIRTTKGVAVYQSDFTPTYQM